MGLENIGGGELIVIVLIGLFIFGPDRLPKAISDGVRMLRNLRQIHQGRGDVPRLLAVLDRQLVLEPEDWDTYRLRGDLLDGLGRTEEAVVDWGLYLEHTPDAADADTLQRRILAARSQRH